MICRWRRQTTAVITDPRGGCGLLPLRSLNRYHLRLQSPQRRAMQLNTNCCCLHSPGNSHTLLLPLPNALGTLIICIRRNTTSQGPETRGSQGHPPAGPCWCYEPSNQALTTSPTHCLLLPGITLSNLQITSCSHQRKRQQIFKLPHKKYMVIPHKIQRGALA